MDFTVHNCLLMVDRIPGFTFGTLSRENSRRRLLVIKTSYMLPNGVQNDHFWRVHLKTALSRSGLMLHLLDLKYIYCALQLSAASLQRKLMARRPVLLLLAGFSLLVVLMPVLVFHTKAFRESNEVGLESNALESSTSEDFESQSSPKGKVVFVACPS